MRGSGDRWLVEAGSKRARRVGRSAKPKGMSNTFTVGAAQMCATDDVAANLAICRALAAEAARRGASLFALPECFAFLGRRPTERQAVAERIDGSGPIL